MKLLHLFFAIAASMFVLPAHAYPDRPITVVMGFAAGGGSDILLRAVTPTLSEKLGQPVVVVYRPGAGGNLAMAAVAEARPDGYTLLMGTPGLATNSSLYSDLPFDPLKDFAPIGLMGSVQNVLIVNPSLPVKTVGELIEYAKSKPGVLNYASPGTGTSLHLAAELFKSVAGLDIVHVPYKGGGQAMTDLLGGQVDLMFNVLPSALPQIKGGQVRALAVTGERRSEALPDVPTMQEAGVPGYTAVTWNGLLAPQGTPDDIVLQINRALAETLKDPAVQARFKELGQDVLSSSPDEFAAFIRNETQKWKKVIEANGIKVN